MAVHPLIAIAEDDVALRGLLAAALEHAGYRVIQVGTGQHLVDVVRHLLAAGEAPRVIITDVRMPALGGIDAAQLLRQAGHTTPMIFMTAYGDAWTRSQASALGAVLLDKPLRLSALREAVQRALAERS